MKGIPSISAVQIFTYLPWLLKEIAKSGWDVTKIILNPRLPVTPELLRVKASQRTSVGVVTYANSITLTPGTISVEVADGAILVHALTQQGASSLATGDMDRRVPRFEGSGVMFAAAAADCSSRWRSSSCVPSSVPSVFDRAQAGNTIGTLAVLLLAVIGFLTGRPEFLDLAIVYGLLNVVGTIAVLKFFRYGDLGRRRTRAEAAGMSVADRRGERVCLVAGAVFCMVGCVGLVRMPDLYTAHACGERDRYARRRAHSGWDWCSRPDSRSSRRNSLIIGMLIFFTSPTATHALARAAFVRGVDAAARRPAGAATWKALIVAALLAMMAAVTVAIARPAQSLRRRDSGRNLQLSHGDGRWSRSMRSMSR